MKFEKLFLFLTMKNIRIFLSVISFLPCLFFAQQVPATQRMDWDKLSQLLKQSNNDFSSLKNNNTYSIYNINNKQYISLYGIEKPTADWALLTS